MPNDTSGGADDVVHDPDSEAVMRILNGWIRSERAFRGRQVWRLHEALDGTTIDRPRYLMLRELVHGGPRRLSDLAEALSLTRSYASRVVDGLVRGGLVTRAVPDRDRRVTVIDVTDAGRETVRSIDDRSRQLIVDRLANFSPEEVERFGEYLDRFAAEVERWSATFPALSNSNRPARHLPNPEHT